MTHNIDKSTTVTTWTGTPTPRRNDAPKWWRRPWMIPLGIIMVAFLINRLPPYLTLDPTRARIAVRHDFPLHYPLLIGHIVCGTVAQVTVVLQVWPWLRRRHPAVHRWSGRLYVFAGALPSALFSLSIVPFTPPVGRIGVAMAGVLWFATTLVGYRMARLRRYAEHRRWMLYSFAIITGINYWGLAIVELALHAPFRIGVSYILESARWFGWVINLFIVQWWIEHRPFVPAQEHAARRRVKV